MITLNPQYEEIFDPHNLDEDCNRIAGGIDVVGETIKEILKVGMYKQAVTMYLQLLKSMTKHFIEDEHWCYFDDWYSPDFALRQIYETILKYDIGEEAEQLLDEGHAEILASESYQDYGIPSYILRKK